MIRWWRLIVKRRRMMMISKSLELGLVRGFNFNHMHNALIH
jgi:hypothetical protein